jgi:hypothetical protein
MKRLTNWGLPMLVVLALGLFGCEADDDTNGGGGGEDAATGAGGEGGAGAAGGEGGAGAAGGAGGAGAAGGAGGAGAAGGEGGAGAAGGAGGAGAAGGEGGAGAAGGAGGEGGQPPPGCGEGPACAEGQICRDGRCFDDGCVCPDVFAPVCGADGNTYGNACEADCAGMLIAYEGECRPACPDANDPNVHYVSDSAEECAALRFVCEEGQEAFNNACGCGCIGPAVEPACGPDRPCADGQVCREGVCVPDEGCVCPDIFAPVCGTDGVTYGNGCQARCAGVRVAYEGECRADCPDPNDPNVRYVSQDPAECARVRFVCDEGQEMFSNACGCGCIGVAVEPACGPDRPCPRGQACREGVCVPDGECVCPAIYAPVCGVDGVTYDNPCSARCVGVAIAYEGECRVPACGPDRPCPRGQVCEAGQCVPGDVCVCPDVFMPVCGVDGVTYGNECQARCAGVAIAYAGECRAAQCGPDRPCPRGQVCEAGQCVPVPVCPDGPNYNYISRDRAQCAAINFRCEAPAQPFFNDCGCGCVLPEGQCHAEQCGPERLPPIVECADGSQGGPTGLCLEGADGCFWEIRECPPANVCGGIRGLQCGRGERCEHPAGSCRIADVEGICEPIPEICNRIFAPVCGCDGMTYGNDCERERAGAQLAYEGQCRGGIQ